MSSKELWELIFKGEAYNSRNTVKDQEILFKRRRKYELIGEITGVALVLAIYGVILYYLIRIFYPIKLIQAMAISFLMYMVAKIISIPILKHKTGTTVNNYYNDNDYFENY
jgi:uncharacterized membrane protein YagU involved in acid resistance